MSTSIPPAPVPDPATEIAAAPLSEPQRIINIFIAPRETFMDIRHNASWWVPWLLGTLAVMAFLFTVEKKVGYEVIVNNRIAHASFLQRTMERMPPEQRQQAIDKQIQSASRNLYIAPVTALAGSLIFAALLMLTFNFVFDAGIKYKTTLALVFYSSLPKIISAVVAIIVLMLGVDADGYDMENPIATNLGALLGSNTDQRTLYHFLSGFDLISMWWVFLLGLGFATVSRKKISTASAVTAVAAWYFAGILLRVAIAPFAG